MKSEYIQITCDQIKLELWNKYLPNKTSKRRNTRGTTAALVVIFGNYWPYLENQEKEQKHVNKKTCIVLDLIWNEVLHIKKNELEVLVD